MVRVSECISEFQQKQEKCVTEQLREPSALFWTKVGLPHKVTQYRLYVTCNVRSTRVLVAWVYRITKNQLVSIAVCDPLLLGALEQCIPSHTVFVQTYVAPGVLVHCAERCPSTFESALGRHFPFYVPKKQRAAYTQHGRLQQSAFALRWNR